MPSEKTMTLKQELVKELAEKLKAAKGIVLADYRGLTVDQDTRLRKTLREAGVDYQVIKNSTINFAAKEANIIGLDELLVGPTAIAISTVDPIAPSKFLTKFAKDFEKFDVKGGLVDGVVLDVEGVKEVASMNSKEDLIAKMLGSMMNPISGLARVLNAIAEQKSA